MWLAPPNVQTAMRNAAWWSIIWLDPVLELPADASILRFGEVGIDALGRRAPRCAVFDWVWPKEPIYKPKIPWSEWVQEIPELPFTNIPVEQYLAGGILRELTHSFGAHNQRRAINERPPTEEQLNHARDVGAQKGLEALEHKLRRQQAVTAKLLDRHFQVGAAIPR